MFTDLVCQQQMWCVVCSYYVPRPHVIKHEPKCKQWAFIKRTKSVSSSCRTLESLTDNAAAKLCTATCLYHFVYFLCTFALLILFTYLLAERETGVFSWCVCRMQQFISVWALHTAHNHATPGNIANDNKSYENWAHSTSLRFPNV